MLGIMAKKKIRMRKVKNETDRIMDRLDKHDEILTFEVKMKISWVNNDQVANGCN